MKSKKKMAPSNPSLNRHAQEKRLQKIAHQYDRLEEALSRLEAMLPAVENSEGAEADAWRRPRKPR